MYPNWLICRCNEVNCRPLESPSHGSVSIHEYQAFFQCNEGYQLQGEKYLECSHESVWSGEATNPNEAYLKMLIYL